MYKLICHNNPKALGIEAEDGSWNMDKFREHILSCPDCREWAGNLLKGLQADLAGVSQMWKCRYMLADGRWQSWMVFDDFQEALENCQFHGQGRPFEIMQYETGQGIEDALDHLEKAISLMEKSRQAFKSKTIALARQEVEKAREMLDRDWCKL